MQRHDENIVENHVGDTRGYGKDKSKARTSGRYEEGLEQRLQKAGRGKEQDDPQIGNTVIHQHRRCAEQTADLTAEDIAEDGAQNTDDHCSECKGGKVPVGFLMFSLTDLRCDNSAAAGTEHDTDREKNADGRINDVDGGKRHTVDVLCDEKAVYNTVE